MGIEYFEMAKDRHTLVRRFAEVAWFRSYSGRLVKTRVLECVNSLATVLLVGFLVVKSNYTAATSLPMFLGSAVAVTALLLWFYHSSTLVIRHIELAKHYKIEGQTAPSDDLVRECERFQKVLLLEYLSIICGVKERRKLLEISPWAMEQLSLFVLFNTLKIPVTWSVPLAVIVCVFMDEVGSISASSGDFVVIMLSLLALVYRSFSIAHRDNFAYLSGILYAESRTLGVNNDSPGSP